jgi:hypothetical protein
MSVPACSADPTHAPQDEAAALPRLQALPLPGTCTQPRGSLASQRVLFLDVDGVLNMVATLESREAIVTRGWPGPLARPLLKRLKRVLERTHALIVLSSSWREHELGRRALLNGLMLVGIDGRLVIGSTPVLGGPRRAPEILQWVDDFGPCATWAAVDDIDLWAEAPRVMDRHAVRTRLTSGLTAEAARELTCFLRANGDEGDIDAARGAAAVVTGQSIPPLGKGRAVMQTAADDAP